ncbi:hypothetical protein P7C70_g6198, partial [Phenoliferia sp. Uapishka_3]
MLLACQVGAFSQTNFVPPKLLPGATLERAIFWVRTDTTAATGGEWMQSGLLDLPDEVLVRICEETRLEVEEEWRCKHDCRDLLLLSQVNKRLRRLAERPLWEYVELDLDEPLGRYRENALAEHSYRWLLIRGLGITLEPIPSVFEFRAVALALSLAKNCRGVAIGTRHFPNKERTTYTIPTSVTNALAPLPLVYLMIGHGNIITELEDAELSLGDLSSCDTFVHGEFLVEKLTRGGEHVRLANLGAAHVDGTIVTKLLLWAVQHARNLRVRRRSGGSKSLSSDELAELTFYLSTIVSVLVKNELLDTLLTCSSNNSQGSPGVYN